MRILSTHDINEVSFTIYTLSDATKGFIFFINSKQGSDSGMQSDQCLTNTPISFGPIRNSLHPLGPSETRMN